MNNILQQKTRNICCKILQQKNGSFCKITSDESAWKLGGVCLEMGVLHISRGIGVGVKMLLDAAFCKNVLLALCLLSRIITGLAVGCLRFNSAILFWIILFFVYRALGSRILIQSRHKYFTRCITQIITCCLEPRQDLAKHWLLSWPYSASLMSIRELRYVAHSVSSWIQELKDTENARNMTTRHVVAQ